MATFIPTELLKNEMADMVTESTTGATQDTPICRFRRKIATAISIGVAKRSSIIWSEVVILCTSVLILQVEVYG